MTSAPQTRAIRDQIRHAVDPKGEYLPLVDAVSELPDLPEWIASLGGQVKTQWSEAVALSAQFQPLLASMSDALTYLVPRGWSPFRMDSALLSEAVNLVKSGRGDRADDLLAGQWDGEDGDWRTKGVCDRVRVMGAGSRQRDYEDTFHQRARLLGLAKQHHDAGRYEASIPIIHAQMEGIVMDVTGGKKFFTSTKYKADLVNPTQLVGIEACLAALQGVYGESIPQTQAVGSLSRHGVAHGRELAYDTRVNSAKNWSVLDALVDWALPISRAEAERRRADQQAAHAGSDDVDADGRRVDDREFRETRDALRTLETAAMGWWERNRRFRDDLVGSVYSTQDFVKKGLPVQHGVKCAVSRDGQAVWYWRETVSGWFLGLALAKSDPRFSEWLYSGPAAPSGSPVDRPEEWGDPFATLPDWT